MTFPARNQAILAFAALAASLLVARGPLRACLWDTDTLANEARGLPDVVRVITGRFDRNPLLFYEMRLKHATSRVESDPDALAAYDDAAVSCDRLGRGDDAIAWAERKRERIEAAEAQGRKLADHRYRYLANVGTFWVHRWFKNGADRARLDEVKTARDFIARAIALNPDAHFGRERYQLAILDWIIDPPSSDPASDTPIPTVIEIGPKYPSLAGGEDPRKAVEGLTGLITLGNAWESVDVFNGLSVALVADGERTSVAYMARWRAEELVEAGKGSILPDAPRGEALARRLWRPVLTPQDEQALRAAYQSLRRESDARHEARTAYMLRRLEVGSHPDTDPHFWEGYRDPAPPTMDSVVVPTVGRGSQRRAAFADGSPAVAAALGVAATATLLVLLRRPLSRWTGRRPRPQDPTSCAA